VLTHGDTLTTWLAALVGKLTRTPVMHVESGLRSFDLRRPFPEEINRLITFRLADHFACPGDWALENLRRYDGAKLNTFVNTQVDTLRFGIQHAHEAKIQLPRHKYVVAKLGFKERLEKNAGIWLLPRLEYLPFIKAVMGSEFVVTDGGGNQEELSYLGKPTLILRARTERREGLGENAIVSGTDENVISRFVEDYKTFERPQRIPSHSPSRAIVDYLVEHGFGR
jgi:UDP-N-acetylglucosamine 2-epimerase (non-hydrolysing)